MKFVAKKYFFIILLLIGTFCYVLLHFLAFRLPKCSELVKPKPKSKLQTTGFQKWLSRISNVTFPPDAVINAQWQVGVKNETFIFSAYYDRREKPHGTVRIIGMSNAYKWTFFSQSYQYCQLWYSDTVGDHTGYTGNVVMKLSQQLIPETHNRKYAPKLFTCYLPDARRPSHVSVSSSPCGTADNLIPVQGADWSTEEKPQKTFTVCTAPLIHNYSNVNQLVEFIESNRVFGAEQFVLYDYDIHSSIYPYLHEYIKDGLVQLVQWPQLPVRAAEYNDKPEIHYFGQVIALADCVYRRMFDSQYVVYIDLDEIIVPHTVRSWADLIRKVQHPKQTLFNFLYSLIFGTKEYGAFSFQNRFFPHRDSVIKRNVSEKNKISLALSDESSPVRKYDIHSLLETEANPTIYSHGVRSKCIMKPKHILLPGIHFVFAFHNSRIITHKFDAGVALLHHYRNEENVSSTKESVTDDIMWTYAGELLPRIVSMHKSVQDQINN